VNPIEIGAELFGVPVEALRKFLEGHWQPGDAGRAGLRLAIYRLPAAVPKKTSRPDLYRSRVKHLLSQGLAPSCARAIELVAIEFEVKAGTVHEAIYRRRTSRVPPGLPPDSTHKDEQSPPP
jgi:hypothetical protein